MSLQSVKKELETLKKECAPNFKTIEELLKTKPEDMNNLTDNELFRIIQYYNPELKSEADLTNEILEKLAKGEDP